MLINLFNYPSWADFHKSRVLSATDEVSFSDAFDEQEAIVEQVTERSAVDSDDSEDQTAESKETQREQNPDPVLFHDQV